MVLSRNGLLVAFRQEQRSLKPAFTRRQEEPDWRPARETDDAVVQPEASRSREYCSLASHRARFVRGAGEEEYQHLETAPWLQAFKGQLAVRIAKVILAREAAKAPK